MKLYYDKHIKFFHLFLASFLFLLLLSGIALCINYTEAAKEMLLSHDEALVTSLLAQGVPRDVIAVAITSEESNKTGADFLMTIGRTQNSAVSFTPFLHQFQKTIQYSMLLIVFLLSLFLLGGTFFFLWKRESLYQETAAIVKSYINGDYSQHLPQKGEGSIYHVFYLIEQLATMLQAKGEAEHRTKEFLKNTISDISHQLKTPLAALSMYQEIMENEPGNTDVIKEFSRKMGLALTRMEQLIQSMLKITRLDAGSIVFEKRNCRIPELVEHSLEELTTRAETENKSILLTYPKEHGARSVPGSSDTLVCDREWTSEAIGNIVKNALDHTDSGDVIRISWECSPYMARIRIADTGNGIAPEDIHHIFKRFYRSKASLDTQGIGLGLPLAKSIIEGQGGVISVQSVLHEGTAFTLSFLR